MCSQRNDGQIHDFDLKIGSGYDRSLFYNNDQVTDKASRNEDHFTAKFVELKPIEKIIQPINFHSDRSEFQEETHSSTIKITVTHKNIPIGDWPKENEAEVEQSLHNE